MFVQVSMRCQYLANMANNPAPIKEIVNDLSDIYIYIMNVLPHVQCPARFKSIGERTKKNVTKKNVIM